MASQAYQTAATIDSAENTSAAIVAMHSAIEDALIYGFTLDKVLLDGARRLRFTLSGPLPQNVLDSYLGSIIPLGA